MISIKNLNSFHPPLTTTTTAAVAVTYLRLIIERYYVQLSVEHMILAPGHVLTSLPRMKNAIY